MESKIVFTALGGGESVGASCYLLKLDNQYVMLDCGTGIIDGIVFEPNFYRAIMPPFMESMNSLGQVFVSHAHVDHMGCLAKLVTEHPTIPIYMTETTKKLIEYQLEKNNAHNLLFRDDYDKCSLALRKIKNSILCRSYNEEIMLGNFSAMLYKAGHIPGAAMVHIKYRDRSILYTGDFLEHPTAITDGFAIPEELHPDTVIMCGLHAKHPCYTGNYSGLANVLKSVKYHISQGHKVYLRVTQLSKGTELLKYLNKHLGSDCRVNIAMDDDIYSMVRKFEQLNMPMLKPNNYSIRNGNLKRCRIMIGTSSSDYYPDFKEIKTDFTLHEDFYGLYKFIKRLKPKTAVIVHCSSEEAEEGFNIKEKVEEDPDLDTQVIFAEDGQAYTI